MSNRELLLWFFLKADCILYSCNSFEKFRDTDEPCSAERMLYISRRGLEYIFNLIPVDECPQEDRRFFSCSVCPNASIRYLSKDFALSRLCNFLSNLINRRNLCDTPSLRV